MNEPKEIIKKWVVDKIFSDKEIEKLAYESTKTSQEYEKTVEQMKLIRNIIINHIQGL